MVRDRLICGINEPRIQRRLLAETKVDFKRAMEIAQAMETADRDATHLQGLQKEPMPTETAVHVARKPQGWKGPALMQTVTGVVADISPPSASSKRPNVTPAERSHLTV